MSSLAYQNKYEREEWQLTFLKAIHGNNTVEIRFISDDQRKGVTSMLIHDNSIFYQSMKNKKSKKCELTLKNFKTVMQSEYLYSGGGVFFTVNSPNFNEMDSCVVSDRHIQNGGVINCQFVDIDAPKEIKRAELELKRWKNQVAKKIMKFPLKPSIVVETKNGYHVYWLLENGEHSLFRKIQLQLVEEFNGDKQCVNEARILRMPNYFHTKDPKSPFPVQTQLFEPERRDRQRELIDSLPPLDQETEKKITKPHKDKNYKNEKIPDFKNNTILQLIMSKIDYVKRCKNKISMHCCLPDHPDKNPSAFIDTERMWYHCSGCESSYSIKKLAEKLGWKDVEEAWNYYNLDVEEELKKIKKQLTDVSDLPHLIMNSRERERVEETTKQVVNQFAEFGQTINEKHKQYIHDTIQVMYKATKDKPYLIPLDMGAGKSLMIKKFIEESLKESPSFGAVVSLELTADVKNLVNDINKSVGFEAAYPMYGFRQEECLYNNRDKKKL